MTLATAGATAGTASLGVTAVGAVGAVVTRTAAGAVDALAHTAGTVPGALARWWLGPWALLSLDRPIGRDEALQLVIAIGGALLLAYAAWSHTAHRASAVQVRGLAMAGSGFLLAALSSASLRAHGALGPVVSLVGVALVFKASQTLVRERQAAREAEADRAGRHDAPPGDGPRG